MSVVYPGSVFVDQVEEIYQYSHHVSNIFPEDTDETCLIVAGGTDNIFGGWALLVDDMAGHFDAVFATSPGHIVAILIEDCNQTDERYLLEISYGGSKVMVARTRFMKSGVLVNVEHSTRIRSIHIPVGEDVYYRLKCETLSKTAYIHLRYYLT